MKCGMRKDLLDLVTIYGWFSTGFWPPRGRQAGQQRQAWGSRERGMSHRRAWSRGTETSRCFLKANYQIIFVTERWPRPTAYPRQDMKKSQGLLHWPLSSSSSSFPLSFSSPIMDLVSVSLQVKLWRKQILNECHFQKVTWGPKEPPSLPKLDQHHPPSDPSSAPSPAPEFVDWRC